MCLAIPARVIEINDILGMVEIGGIQREVSMMLLPEAKVGDYVLVHAGYAIQMMDEAEAEETLRLFAELAEAEEQT